MVGSDLEQVMLNPRPVSFNVEVSAKWKPLSFSRYPSCLTRMQAARRGMPGVESPGTVGHGAVPDRALDLRALRTP